VQGPTTAKPWGGTRKRTVLTKRITKRNNRLKIARDRRIRDGEQPQHPRKGRWKGRKRKPESEILRPKRTFGTKKGKGGGLKRNKAKCEDGERRVKGPVSSRTALGKGLLAKALKKKVRKR